MSCKCYKLVCIDFKITRWNFDIDSKVVEFLLQENEHTYTHKNPTVFARSLCPTLAHPVLHVAFAQTFCALTHNQCVLSSCVSKWIIDARTHFPGRKIQKFLYACSAQRTHNQRPPWTRPQPTYMYTARTAYEDGKFVSVCACMSLRMVTHTNITQNSIPVSTSTHWDNFHDVLLAATANFPNIQHTIWWTVFLLLLSSICLATLAADRHWRLNELKLVVTSDPWYFSRLHCSIKSSFIIWRLCIVYRTIWLQMTFATWILFRTKFFMTVEEIKPKIQSRCKLDTLMTERTLTKLQNKIYFLFSATVVEVELYGIAPVPNEYIKRRLNFFPHWMSTVAHIQNLKAIETSIYRRCIHYIQTGADEFNEMLRSNMNLSLTFWE